MIRRNCNVCGNFFWSKRPSSSAKTCSKECHYKLASKSKGKKGVYKKCKACDTEIYVLPSNAKDGRGKYCSKECQFRDKKNGKMVSCCNCGKEIYKPKSSLENNKRHCCSVKCQYESRNGSKEVECKYCANKFNTHKSDIKDSGNRYCSKKCYHESTKTGEYVNCEMCNNEFWLNPYNKDIGTTCCSSKCAGKKRSAERVVIECDNCGVEFKRLESQIRGQKNYCSIECHYDGAHLYPRTLNLRAIIKNRNKTKDLKDVYLKAYIKRHYNIDEVPKEIIELKRLGIQRKRKLKEITHGDSQ